MMKSVMFCTFFFISSSLGLSVSFGSAYLFQDTWDEMPELLCRQHQFTYHRGDYFRMFIILAGGPIAMNQNKVEVFVKKQAGTILFRQHILAPTLQSLVDLNLDSDKITIEVRLTTTKSCEMVKVLEGTEVSTLANDEYELIPYINNICLKGQRCMLFINLTGLCQDVKLKTQQCAAERDFYVPADEDSEVRDTQTAARQNCLDDSSTSTLTNNSVEEADDSYFSIMVVALVAAAILMILLFMIIIQQRCWVNCKPAIDCLPQFSTTNENRFYENVVFRPKSEPEVEQRVAHIYDEPFADKLHQEFNRRARLN